MSQPMSQPPVRQTHHILIVDDSARMRYALADMIVAVCTATGRPYRVLHGDKNGKYTPASESINATAVPANLRPLAPDDPTRLDDFVIYTAPSPKQALYVVNSPIFSKLTIISDVMMPADTEVGLVGMLDAIVKRNLAVNLVFASSDAQNRFIVQKIVESGKAYFVEKSNKLWEELSLALVTRSASFKYQRITQMDYAGVQTAVSQAMHNNRASTFAEEVLNPHENYEPPAGPIANPVTPNYGPPPRPPLPTESPRSAPPRPPLPTEQVPPPRPPLPTGQVPPPRPPLPSIPAYRNNGPAAYSPPQPERPAAQAPVREKPPVATTGGGFVLFRPFKALWRALRGR